MINAESRSRRVLNSTNTGVGGGASLMTRTMCNNNDDLMCEFL